MEVLIRDIVENSGKKYGELAAVKWLAKKEILERSYRELEENVKALRKGLLAEGFQGKHIALIGGSSVEWIESYLSIVTGRTTAVPLDAGLPAEDLIDLIDRSDAEGLFISPRQAALLEEISAKCSKLRRIWLLQEDLETSEGETEPAGLKAAAGNAADGFAGKVRALADLKAASANSAEDSERPAPEDVATIIFTSGTTGKSKGVMLTQNNLAANVAAVDFTAAPGTAILSVLPIHHAFCLVMDWLKGFSLGATVCINDSLLHLVKNMGVFQPEIMLMVPLMIETIYKRLSNAGGVGAMIPKKLLGKKVFGKNLRIIFSGGAHLDPYYIEKFAEYGVDIYEGYGMSECSPVISTNTPENHKPGSIGRPLSNVEIAFEDGEILARGSSVMKGYYKMPAETAETLRDGWLHTGDKGYLDEDGYLFINGRVKNLIILSNGENISPEEIENKLGLNPLVGEVVITGENNGLTARIYPDPDVTAKKKLTEETVRLKLQEFLDEYNQAQPTYRRITALVVRKNPFIKNSTRKIKRQEVLVDEPLN